MRILLAGLFIFSLLLIISCGRTPIEQSRQAMRLTKPPKTLMDDLPLDQLAKGMEENIEQLNKLKIQSLTFGPRVISKNDYILSLTYLVYQIKSGASRTHFIETVVNNFDFYEVYGKDKWGEVLITSYFHPIIPGS